MAGLPTTTNRLVNHLTATLHLYGTWPTRELDRSPVQRLLQSISNGYFELEKKRKTTDEPFSGHCVCTILYTRHHRQRLEEIDSFS